MDGNKDEALKCLKIAQDSIESGDKTRAMKFLHKAHRLDPSIEIAQFLSNLNGSQPENNDLNQSTGETPFDPLRNGTRRRVPAAGTSSSSSATYTQEQITVVREIKKKKDYYQILGLEKSCSSEEIKKAYRKLILKVHPDKNTAPGAEEAFKMVSKAFQCLSDEETRKKYDVSGSDEPVYERRGGGGFNDVRGFNGFYAGGDVDADEIFRNFFFGGMNPATTGNFGFSFGPGVRVRTGGVGVDQGSNWARTLIQLLPVLFILLVNFMPSSEPAYSLSQSFSYNYRFTTQKGVNFYVKSASFGQHYPPNSQERAGFEQRVENDYQDLLVQHCRNEYQQVQWGYRKTMPSCETLKIFEAKVQ